MKLGQWDGGLGDLGGVGRATGYLCSRNCVIGLPQYQQEVGRGLRDQVLLKFNNQIRHSATNNQRQIQQPSAKQSSRNGWTTRPSISPYKRPTWRDIGCGLPRTQIITSHHPSCMVPTLQVPV